MNNRIRYLRKEVLKLTQQAFSEKINISRSNIGNIETGEVAATDRLLTTICKEFGVSLDWLKYGEGEIFTTLTRSEAISKFAEGLIKESDDSFRKQLVEVLAELNESEWKALEGIAKKIGKKRLRKIP